MGRCDFKQEYLTDKIYPIVFSRWGIKMQKLCVN